MVGVYSQIQYVSDLEEATALCYANRACALPLLLAIYYTTGGSFLSFVFDTKCTGFVKKGSEFNITSSAKRVLSNSSTREEDFTFPSTSEELLERVIDSILLLKHSNSVTVVFDT